MIAKLAVLALVVASLMSFNIGSLANALVMSANDGRMPVLTPYHFAHEYVIDARHCAVIESTRYKLLADRFPIGDVVASIGDLLMWASIPLSVIALFVGLFYAFRWLTEKTFEVWW